SRIPRRGRHHLIQRVGADPSCVAWCLGTHAPFRHVSVRGWTRAVSSKGTRQSDRVRAEHRKENLPMGRFIRTIATVLVALGLVVASRAGAAGAAAQDEDKPTVVVGSKDFTEQIIVAEMVALLLEDNGYNVERQLNLGGTAVVHQALVSGEIDIYVEYTGTGLLAILGQELPEMDAAGATPAADSGQDQVYEIVSSEYEAQFGLEWLEPWGFNNTYALAVTQETAEEYDLRTI